MSDDSILNNTTWIERKEMSFLRNHVLMAVPLAIMAVPVVATSAPMWTLLVASQSGDPIGSGVTQSFSQSAGALSTPDVLDLTGDGQVDYLAFFFTNNDASQTWDLTFGTSSFLNSNLGSLTPGTYTNAQKAPFADTGHPGLDFSLNGIAASTLTGQFTITDAH